MVCCMLVVTTVTKYALETMDIATNGQTTWMGKIHPFGSVVFVLDTPVVSPSSERGPPAADGGKAHSQFIESSLTLGFFYHRKFYHMEFSWNRGLPLVIIHFTFGFSSINYQPTILVYPHVEPPRHWSRWDLTKAFDSGVGRRSGEVLHQSETAIGCWSSL